MNKAIKAHIDAILVRLEVMEQQLARMDAQKAKGIHARSHLDEAGDDLPKNMVGIVLKKSSKTSQKDGVLTKPVGKKPASKRAKR